MATYVISDIHSHLENLNRFLADTVSSDTIYCLGDTIDKGKDGFKVFLKMMEDERVVFLMGNHELMMYLFLDAQKRRINDPTNLMISEYYYHKKDHWQFYNYGLDTYNDYMKLPREQREAVFEYFKTMPVQINVTVNNRTFLLVHSQPFGDFSKNLYYNDIKEDIDHYVWDRAKNCHVDGKIVVTGHNVVRLMDGNGRIIETDGEWYDIDCGLAANDAYSRLAALRLDDLSVKYY